MLARRVQALRLGRIGSLKQSAASAKALPRSPLLQYGSAQRCIKQFSTSPDEGIVEAVMGCVPSMNLSAEQVKSEITRYWGAFVAKDAATLSDFYAHESVGFSSRSRRSEPGRMAAIRRDREYFQHEGRIHSTIEGIEIVLLGDSVAVAAYTFSFNAIRVNALGKIVVEDIQDGRATQVFAFDTDGRLRIFHEHFSEAAG